MSEKIALIFIKKTLINIIIEKNPQSMIFLFFLSLEQ